ncbi:hypothetical protein PYW07_013409 [Mythimna separata]|uniref:Sodium channel protein Nach n=1 Tax=Mythimna separata TaxID=271217 RepID=A0AAD7Y6B5_MYTSE|nr:hypothetical protein PYW07_013409 [Mythimna separata]
MCEYTNDYHIYQEEKPWIITRWVTSIVKCVVKCGKDFCKETSIHGFNHIAASRRHWIERLLWVAATAFATWGAVDVSLGQLQRYNESPTVVTLEKDFRSWRFSVPAITMCYKNRLNKAKLPAVIKKYFNTEPSDEKYDYYARLVEAITDSDLFNLQRFQEFSHLDTSVDMFGIAVDVMPEPDIKTRSSEEVTFKWIPMMTESGACYVTNSVALADVAIVTPNPNDTARWPETCKYSSLSCYIVMDVPAFADFYFHSPYDVMDLTHSPSHVRLTLVRTTELSVMESRCGRGVVDLQPTRRGCSYTNESTASGRKVHSTNTCRLSCRSKLAKKFCDCVPFYYFYDEGPLCTPKGMACLSNYSHKLSNNNGQKYGPLCTPKGMACLSNYSHKLSNNNGQKCPCAPQCIDSIYKEISTVDQIWDRPPFNVHGSIKFAVQAPRTRYTREIVFHFQDLVVSFGGAAGLFLGASFISFVEILYFLMARPFRTTVRREETTNKTTAVLKVKPVPVSHETLRINQLTAILEAQKKYNAVPGYYY